MGVIKFWLANKREKRKNKLQKFSPATEKYPFQSLWYLFFWWRYISIINNKKRRFISRNLTLREMYQIFVHVRKIINFLVFCGWFLFLREIPHRKFKYLLFEKRVHSECFYYWLIGFSPFESLLTHYVYIFWSKINSRWSPL